MEARKPRVISTWSHGIPANEQAWAVLASGGSALDAVETGVRQSEADPHVSSVGLGGRPDRSGQVTLDASIMDHRGQCGAVACLKDIVHAISVARRVMEKTPHVLLVGEGARQFAIEQGFPTRDLLTDASRQAWEEWRAESAPEFQPEKNIEQRNLDNHDTIGMVALDAQGNLSGACTTSGLAWKMPGRVGDSPIIGAGLYVDNEIGAASATGVGEAVIRVAGSFLVVELMRQGHSPEEACRLAVERVITKSANWRDLQVAFIAVDTSGHVGAYSIAPGFQYAVADSDGNRLISAESHL